MTLSQRVSRPYVAELARRHNLGILAAAFIVNCIIVFRSDWGVLVTDTKPELYLDPVGTLRGSLSGFAPNPYLGSQNFNGGVLPVAALVSLLHIVIEPAWVLQRVLRVLLGVVAFWGAGRAARKTGVSEKVGWIAAAVLYTFGPFAFVAGSTLPIAVPHAVLPWLLLAVARAVRPQGTLKELAASTALFGAMTGINAGSVPLLLLLPVFVVGIAALAAARGARLAVALRAVALAISFGVISLYWLVPALLASGSGQQIVGTTESMDAIAATSSWSEAVRGLGLWPAYGGDAHGPWQPGFSAYITNPVVIVATVVPLVLAAVGVARLGRRALVPTLLVAAGASLMVGLHPIESPSTFGSAIQKAFEAFPALLALRTTVKSGSSVALAVAVLAGAGAVAVHVAVVRWSKRQGRGPYAARRASTAAALGGLACASLLAYPAIRGSANPQTMNIPDYWSSAAASLNDAPPDTGVWFLPGTNQTTYRWGYSGPDDVVLGLVKGRTIRRTTVPNSTPAATDFLAGVDNSLARGDAPADLVSTAAEYLGVGRVVLRADIDTTGTGGISPGRLQARLDADPGLVRTSTFGDFPSAWADSRDVALPDAALVVYDVRTRSYRPSLRSATGTTTLVGDPSALGAIVRAGLLPTDRPIHLASKMDPGTFAKQLRRGTRIEVTDGAERRGVSVGAVGAPTTPLLTASESPFSARTVSDSTEDQTVRVFSGARAVRATSNGSTFGPTAHDSPAAALDGDPKTAWMAGDFNNAIGQRWWVDFTHESRVGTVRLALADSSPVQIAGLRVTAGAVHRDLDVAPDAENVQVDMGEVMADRLTVEVTKIHPAPGGNNGVGLAEVDIDGLRITPTVRTPRTLASLTSSLSRQDRQLLALTPLDVVVRRYQGVVGNEADDEERSIHRTVNLPDRRAFLPVVTLRTQRLPDAMADRLAGTQWDVQARASSRKDDSPLYRPSLVLDGDDSSAWVPEEGVGEWLELQLPSPQSISSLDLNQVQNGGRIKKVLVSLDGRQVETHDLAGVADSIKVPQQTARTVRLEVVEVDDSKAGVGIASLSIPGVPVRPRGTGSKCLDLGTWDSSPIRGQVLNVPEFLRFGVTKTAPCADSRTLTAEAGDHVLNTASGLSVDDVTLYDAQHLPAAPNRDIGVAVRGGSHGMNLRVTLPARDTVTSLSLGLADLGWVATARGLPISEVDDLDGYAAGWMIPAGDATTVTIRYPHAGVITASQWFSGLLGVLILLVLSSDRVTQALGQGAKPTLMQRPLGVPLSSRPMRHSTRRKWLVCAVVLLASALTSPWSMVIVLPVVAVVALCGWPSCGSGVSRRLALVAGSAAVALPLCIWAARGFLPSGPSFDLIRHDSFSPALAASWAWLLVLASAFAGTPKSAPQRPDRVRRYE